MSINTSMMQNFGLEDLSHVQSRRNLLNYLVRVEMASGWLVYEDLSIDFGRTKFPPKSRYGVQTTLRGLLEPTIIIIIYSIVSMIWARFKGKMHTETNQICICSIILPNQCFWHTQNKNKMSGNVPFFLGRVGEFWYFFQEKALAFPCI